MAARVRQVTAAAKAARDRAAAANRSLLDLWGAAVATCEAAGCTKAQVCAPQFPYCGDVQAALLRIDISCALHTLAIACDDQRLHRLHCKSKMHVQHSFQG